VVADHRRQPLSRKTPAPQKRSESPREQFEPYVPLSLGEVIFEKVRLFDQVLSPLFEDGPDVSEVELL
jgi:hypothetical protein